MAKNPHRTRPPAPDKDRFVTETMLDLVGFGDFLLTTESTIKHCSESGLRAIAGLHGSCGQSAKAARRFFSAHRKRFDRDMARVLRYTAVVGLYILLETTARKFITHFSLTCPSKPGFRQNNRLGFVASFRSWLETPPMPVRLAHPKIWQLLDDLRVIRNCIVHANGDLKIETDPGRVARCRETVRRIRRIRFDVRGTLVMDAEFAFEVCERLQTFFRLLFRETGYRLALPPGYADSISTSFAGFEDELAQGIKAYDARQTINLGGFL